MSLNYVSMQLTHWQNNYCYIYTTANKIIALKKGVTALTVTPFGIKNYRNNATAQYTKANAIIILVTL